MTAAALYDGHVLHLRRTPLNRVFRQRIYLWLVDLDRLPSFPWWVRPFTGFRSADHLGDPDRSLRANVDVWLGERGVDLGGGRVLMLASARVLGYVFNPITVYWCHRRDGRLACVIAEVSNTYGERYCYLLRIDPHHRAETDKRFYVSPFFEVAGQYRMRLPLPDERLSLTVSLVDRGQKIFTAVLTGHRRPADSAGVLRAALTMPLMPQRISLAIRRHGIALWLRRLPVVPRIPHKEKP